MKNFSNKLFLTFWATILIVAFLFYSEGLKKSNPRKVASFFEDEDQSKIIVDGKSLNIVDFFQNEIHNDDDNSLDSLVRKFLININSNKNDEAWSQSRERYLQIAAKLKNVAYAISTASVQYNTYSEREKEALLKAVESYISAYYVLSWHHAYLYHLNNLPTASDLPTCLDFTKKGSWQTLNNCRLVMEKEFALIANKKLGIDLATLNILSSASGNVPVIDYIQKNIVQLNKYVGLARLDLSQEIKNFLEFNVLKNWKDPLFYAKFLKFNGLREALSNYWSIARYQENPELIMRPNKSKEFLLTNTLSEQGDWLGSNNYLRELFSKDFYFNALNSYTLHPTKNLQEVSIFAPIWSEMLEKEGAIKELLWNDARICKSSLGCQLPEGTDLYLYIVKTLYGSEKSCETKSKMGSQTVSWNCISKLHNIFYGKAEFAMYESKKESDLGEQILSDGIRTDMQKAIKKFIVTNPGIVNNAILPGEDLTNDILKLRTNSYQNLELGRKIISPLLQAKTLLIAGTIFDALGLEYISWNNPLDPKVTNTLKKAEVDAIYKNVYCRTASILWGVNPQDLNSELVECKQETNPSGSFAKTNEAVNKLIYSKFNQPQFAKLNAIEKTQELSYYNNLVDAVSVSEYLANPKVSSHQFRPFDHSSLMLYAKLKVGAIGKENNNKYFEQERFDYLEQTGMLDLSFMLINQKFEEVCARFYPVKTPEGTTTCNNFTFRNIDTKVSLLRKAVYEVIYENFAREQYAKDETNLKIALAAIKNEAYLPIDIKNYVAQKIADYDSWDMDQHMRFQCDKKKTQKTSVSELKNLFKSGHGEQFIKENSSKVLSLNNLAAQSAQMDNLWDVNASKIRSLAGSWNAQEEYPCEQPKEFMTKGYFLVTLGKALGVFDSQVVGAFYLNAEEKKLLAEDKIKLPYSRVISYKEEPALKEYNQFYAQYIYGLMGGRFPFLKSMRSKLDANTFDPKDSWFGTSFLDLIQLRSLKTTDVTTVKTWNETVGLKLINKFLNQAWTDFKTANGRDLINFYDNIKLGDKQLNFSEDFKKLFDHFEDFRFEFSSTHIIGDKISENIDNAKKFLANESTLQSWFAGSADKKIQDEYYPIEAFWEKISPYVMPVLILASILSIYGWAVGGVEFMGAGLLTTLVTLDSVALSFFATQSAYNLIYKNNIDLPSTISAQTKIASSFSFYSPNNLPTTGKWLVNTQNAATTVEKENNENVLSNQIWSYGIKAQNFENVMNAKTNLKSKIKSDTLGLLFDTALFYIPSAPQIRRNFLVLKNGRTLKSVLRNMGLPYMNLTQRVQYFFSKAPEVEMLTQNLKNRPIKEFFKKATLALDPKSQMLILDKVSFKKVEERFLFNLINKDYASRETIDLLFRDASKRSLNPKIDLMHEELELYVDFMKSFLSKLDKLKPEQWQELNAIFNRSESLQHMSFIKTKMRSWLENGTKMESALFDEAEYLKEIFGHLPAKPGTDIADIFSSMTYATEIHAKGGDFLSIALAESLQPEFVKTVKDAHASFIDVKSVINYYDQILNLSKYDWYNISTKYLQNKLNNTLKLEENLLDNIKNSKMPAKIGVKESTYVDQLSMTEKLKMEEELGKAWSMEIYHSEVEGMGLGLMMMLRDYQGMYANLKSSPDLFNFIKKNMGDDVNIQNFFNYAGSKERAPLYPQIIEKYVPKSNIVNQMSQHLEQLQNGGAFYHYIQVDLPGLYMPGLPAPKTP